MIQVVNSSRIYIGGLDPAKLTIFDLLNRLENHLPKEVDISDVHYSSQASSATYLHFTATISSNALSTIKDSTSNESEDFLDPFRMIQKLFHNVTWKGCKLKVEQARPHFLERLQNEINNRRKFQEEPTISEKCNFNVEEHQIEKQVVSCRRYLKVKRRYGQECCIVDTKPCRVSDWNKFRKMQQYLMQKREQVKNEIAHKNNGNGHMESEKNINIRKAYYNRSIHLRFVDSNDYDEIASTVSIDDEFSLKSDPNILHTTQQSDTFNKIALTCTTNQKETNSDKSIDSNSVDQTSKDDSFLKKNRTCLPPVVTAPKIMTKDNKTKRGEYIWSDDESSASSCVSSRKPRSDMSNIPLSVALTNDEFDTNFSLENLIETTCETIPDANSDNPDDIDLGQDVEKNMAVLCQIFPEFKKRSTENLTMDSNESALKSKKGRGWDITWQMLRYDPKLHDSKAKYHVVDSAEAYELFESEKTLVVDQNGDKTVVNTIEKEVSETNVNQNETEKTTLEDNLVTPIAFGKIYEEKKLEEVFRQAREASFRTGFSFSETISDSKQDNSAFSFSFALVDKSNENQTTASLKRDNIDPSVTDQLLEIDQGNFGSVSNEELHRAEVGVPDGERSLQQQSQSRLRYDFLLEDSSHDSFTVLDKLVNFSYHDALLDSEGRRIIEDLPAYRTDASIVELWNTERKILTDDWKRKRKYALSRKQTHFC